MLSKQQQQQQHLFTLGPRIVNKDASSAFTMTNRASVGAFDEDLARTPGPCHYSITQPDIYRAKRPTYSLQGRSFIPGNTFSCHRNPIAHYLKLEEISTVYLFD